MTSAKQRPAARRGSTSRKGSTGKGVAIGLGVGCLVLFLLCGGVIAAFVFVGARVAEEFGDAIENASSEDPDVVREVTAEITEITIPEEFEPEYSFKMELPTSLPLPNTDVDTITPRFVVYTLDDEDGVLMLATVENLNVSAEDMMEHARESFFDPDHWEDIEISDEETREVMIRDEPAEFEFAKGSHGSDDEEFWRVFGTFEGRHGPSAMLIFINAEDYDDEKVVEIIDSIQ